MQQVVVDLYKLKYPNCGLGQVCLHLGRAIARAQSDVVRPAFYLRRRDSHLVASQGVDTVRAWPWRKEKFVSRVRGAFQKLLRPSRCALWHSTDQFCKFWPLDARVPVLLTIHDLNFLREKTPHKAEFYLNFVQAKVDRAAVIATISNFVADEIRAHLNLKGKDVRVIYNGTTFDPQAPANRPRFAPQTPFLFAIGTVVARKNFHVLIDLVRRLPEHQLVVAGKASDEYAEEMKRRIRQEGLSSRITLPGEISDQQRTWLYRHCEAFCFPSLTEGFGLPVVEAMAHGKPVFISDRTSLPEVAGDLAFYFRSFDPQDMADVFRRGMRQFRDRPEMADRLRAKARSFSWDKAAAAYLQLYEEMVTGNERKDRPRWGHAA